MVRVVILLLSVPLIFMTQILTMIYGWGLTPKSWLIIIGGMLLTMFFMMVTDVLKEK
jgi:hypothetical protein